MTNELDLTELTNDVLHTLSAWGTSVAQQAVLLGLATEPHHQLVRVPLPRNNDVLARAQALLAIDQSVCFVFPHTPELGRLWLTTPSHFFAGRPPLDVMLVDGLPGIMNVLSLLEGNEIWS
ncbi:putative DUF2384 domain-containing protein [Gammaproteobacteria bacterium]